MKQAKTHTPKVEIDRETELSTGSKLRRFSLALTNAHRIWRTFIIEMLVMYCGVLWWWCFVVGDR